MQHLKPRLEKLLNRYSDFDSFSKAFDTKQQEYCFIKKELAITSDSVPTLTVIKYAYGEPSVLIWLCKQLADFNEFCGKREKMDEWQIEQLARGIITTLGYLKASEIMLFLYQYKMGQWGPIYGVVDPQEFMVVLTQKFIPWKVMVNEKAENKRKQQEREQWRKDVATPEEIRKIKERINEINNSLQVKKGGKNERN